MTSLPPSTLSWELIGDLALITTGVMLPIIPGTLDGMAPGTVDGTVLGAGIHPGIMVTTTGDLAITTPGITAPGGIPIGDGDITTIMDGTKAATMDGTILITPITDVTKAPAAYFPAGAPAWPPTATPVAALTQWEATAMASQLEPPVATAVLACPHRALALAVGMHHPAVVAIWAHVATVA